MAISQDEIYKKVQGVLVDALGVDEDEVKPDAVIKDDLGAESIDFLDISFRLEKAFAIKIGKGEMMPEIANNPELAQNGKVTPIGIAELKKRMPYSDFTEFEKDPTVDNMSKLFTVKTIVGYVEGKLQAA
ncbi:MAG: acpP 2 [Phycisphaerales bacterium]|nr:acpP 2 [Phycisphaerales bacterium]MDB5356948.1 acpP 2 [Phycisphaerales bacterium]